MLNTNTNTNTNTATDLDKNAQLLSWVSGRPDLMSELEKMRNLVESEQSSLQKLDDAEALLIEQMRTLGNVLLRQWAEDKKAKAIEPYENQAGISKHSKKNLISQRAMVK